MKGTIVTGSLIVFSDGFVWKRLSNEKAYKIWVSAENEDFELYKVRVDDESESLIESLEDLQDAFKQDHHVCIEVGKLPYSIGLNLINGDYTGLSDNEEREIRNFLERVKEDPVDVDWKTEGFYWYNNANNTPGECADFIFYKRND